MAFCGPHFLPHDAGKVWELQSLLGRTYRSETTDLRAGAASQRPCKRPPQTPRLRRRRCSRR